MHFSNITNLLDEGKKVRIEALDWRWQNGQMLLRILPKLGYPVILLLSFNDHLLRYLINWEVWKSMIQFSRSFPFICEQGLQSQHPKSLWKIAYIEKSDSGFSILEFVVVIDANEEKKCRNAAADSNIVGTVPAERCRWEPGWKGETDRCRELKLGFHIWNITLLYSCFNIPSL